MIPFLIDLSVILIIGFFTWSGYRKGLILSATSLVIFFVSLMIGGSIASQNVEKASVFFDDLLGWVADDPTERAISEFGVPRDRSISDAQLVKVANSALVELGVHPKAAVYLSGKVTDVYRRGTDTIYETVSHVFVRSIAWVTLFAAGFLISNLLLSLVANFISAVFKLPILKIIDLSGGAVIGLVTGVLILFAVGMGLRYVGMVLPDGLIADTRFLSMFIDGTPFGDMLVIG